MFCLPTAKRRAAPSEEISVSYDLILIDEPAPRVRRVTLNRPEKRNALNHQLRGEIIHALRAADVDPGISVSIVRGAGKCFSAGYDLGGGNEGQELPWFTAAGDGQFQRNVTEGWMSIWDLAKPVIAQVHSYCLAGGSELATGCDMVFVAEDALMGYPAVRFGVPDMQFHAWFLGMRKAMQMMTTGDPINGIEAARLGWANEAVPADQLEARVLEVAGRVANIPSDIVQLNKRNVHRAMDAMGLRSAIRACTELSALAVYQNTFQDFINNASEKGLVNALQERDQPFSDYRTTEG
jgi:enoyl-CoA hydratase